MAGQDVAIPGSSAVALWLVISADGLQIAGTADVPGVPLDVDRLQAIRAFTTGAGDLPEDLDPVVQLTAFPSIGAVDTGDLPDSPPATTTQLRLPAPVLCLVDDGRILASSPVTGYLVELADRHISVLTRTATGSPTDLDADPEAQSALADVTELGWLIPAPPAEPRMNGVQPPPDDRAEPAQVPEPVPDDARHETDREVTDRELDGHGIWHRIRSAFRRPVDSGPQPVTTVDRTSSEAPAEAPLHDADPRTPVWPVTCADTEIGNALGLGMVIAASIAHDGGRLNDTYDFRPIHITATDALEEISSDGRAGVLLLSSYVWSIGANLKFAAEIKELSPRTIVVIGGPSAPKYSKDAEAFFEKYPQIDVIVRGEGEVTTWELLDALAGDLERIDRLADVAGLSARIDGQIVRTGERSRLEDLNVVPSPYLTGLFDHLSTQMGIWALETNRGCPYGCTFCDWGSATRSRIRKYDLDRVMAELDWLSRRGVQAIFVADANFGIFERDLAITRHVASLHAERGAPVSFIASFAKNTTKYTVPIIRTLITSGLSGDVAIAFQTTDMSTLDNVHRNNIKIEAYDQLARDVRADGLPIVADIMIALPGSTLETLKTDLQHCVDSDVTPRVFGTIVLPNSPMNDPEYREEHRIRTDSFNQVISTTSFTPADREDMVRFRDVFRWADHFGILRHVIRWEAHRSGRREIDILWRMAETAKDDPTHYPLLAFMVNSGRRYLIEPMSWHRFYQEVGRMLVGEMGTPDSTEMQTVLAVQEALMPSSQIPTPRSVSLDHDYVAFYREVLRPFDGQPAARTLSSYGPVEFRVTDPHGISPACLREMFQIEHSPEGARSTRHEGEFWQAFNWELHSPIERALRGQYYDAAKSLPILDMADSPVLASAGGSIPGD